MIESGSTCALLAAELAENRRDVTIVTNSAFIAGYVGRMPGAKTVLLGGNYDPDAQNRHRAVGTGMRPGVFCG